MTDTTNQPFDAQPEEPDNAIAIVSSDDADSVYATVQWLLNPLPGGSLLFKRPDLRSAVLEGLLRESFDALKAWYDDSGFPYPEKLFERIAAALKG